jgi:hypothetical protein
MRPGQVLRYSPDNHGVQLTHASASHQYIALADAYDYNVLGLSPSIFERYREPSEVTPRL